MHLHNCFSKCLAGLVVLCLSSYCMADELANLVRKGQFKGALELAESELDQREGDPEFDLLLAKIYLGLGQFGQATFAIERVQIVQPDSQDAQVTQAEIFLEQGQYDQALIVLEKTKASTPELKVRSTAAKARIAEHMRETQAVSLQSGLSGFVEFALGYDDNFNYGTQVSQLTLANGQVVTLGPQFAERSTSYGKVGFGGSGFKQISPKATLVGYGSVQLRSNQNNPLDSTFVSAGAGYVRNFQSQGLASYVNYSLLESDRRKFRDAQGLTFQYFGPGLGGWNENWNTSFILSYNKLNYATSSRDADQYQFGYTMNRSSEQFAHTLGLYWIEENSDSNLAENERQIITLNYLIEGLRALGPDLTPFANLVLTSLQEGGPRPSLPEVVETDSSLLGLGVKWKAAPALTLKSEIGYYRANSNIDLFDVRRTYFEIGLRYNFN